MALRHIDMARILCKASPSMDDGAVFHTYHAYECIINALIASQRRQIPPAGRSLLAPGVYVYRGFTADIPDRGVHDARLQLLEQFMKVQGVGKPYHAAYQLLKTYVEVDMRHNALYFVSKPPYVWPPDRFSHGDAVRFLARVRGFVRRLWQDIR